MGLKKLQENLENTFELDERKTEHTKTYGIQLKQILKGN